MEIAQHKTLVSPEHVIRFYQWSKTEKRIKPVISAEPRNIEVKALFGFYGIFQSSNLDVK